MSQTERPGRSGPPVIDVSALLQAGPGGASGAAAAAAAAARTVEEVRSACAEWGFFQCINHGISEEVLGQFDRECRAFFDLPLRVKRGIKRAQDNSRGWFDDELTKQRRDWKECIDIGQPGWSEVDGRNQWPDPEAAPRFRPVMEAYYASCLRLSRVLLRAAAVGLGMAADHFDAAAEPHTSYLRLNYYPVCDRKVAPASHGYEEPDPEVDGNLGINKHSDAGCLTVLRQYTDEPASLQVYHTGDRQWYRVVPQEGALTINIGDMMQVWSNGTYRAPLHRVLANTTRVRYSAPFFYNPSYETMVSPVKSALAGPPIYYPLSWAEFRRRRFEGDFGDYSADVQISDWLIEGGKYGGGRGVSRL
jgi:isopenicillin N synthase-like dioxygenase